MAYRGVELKVLQNDALKYVSDLLVLKHAQASYGVDAEAVHAAGIDITTLPRVGNSLLVRKPAGLGARNLLLVGVEPITTFSYHSIRDFSKGALAIAARISPSAREISMTLHGVGFGLDETEAFESEVAGIIEALDQGEYPKSLVTVSILELSQRRVARMRSILASLLGTDVTGPAAAESYMGRDKPLHARIDSVGYDSADRPHAFVAMPFSESFEDVFYYGISPPVRAAGLLCERIDQIHFTGDIIDRMRERIASSAMVVADLSDANPNVYLEVGYAWGMNIPCVLVCNRKTGLKFDLQSQRCLFYGSIKDLEKSLSAELAVLSRQMHWMRRPAKS